MTASGITVWNWISPGCRRQLPAAGKGSLSIQCFFCRKVSDIFADGIQIVEQIGISRRKFQSLERQGFRRPVIAGQFRGDRPAIQLFERIPATVEISEGLKYSGGKSQIVLRIAPQMHFSGEKHYFFCEKIWH